MRRRHMCLVAVALLVTAGWLLPQAAAGSERFTEREVPGSVAALKLARPLAAQGPAGFGPSGFAPTDESRYLIRLKSPSVAEQKVRGRSAAHAKRQLEIEQQDVLMKIFDLDPSARLVGQTQLVLNAVFVEVDAAVLGRIADDPMVASVTPEGRYEMSLSETVPYIGAAAVQAAGYDGTGVRVAILDSGIDYTHANLGGPGTVADYNAAYSDFTSRDGLFPTAKVVEGYDFVGELWPFGPLLPDEDPIDFDGHGTHVADIAGGLGGVAPGADLYAVKVCSALSSACSGTALIQGMEFAVDPDGDGDPADAVDVINMSLGSTWGQPFDDDLAAAVDNATGLGVLTVAAAGNGANRPYVNGTPASAMTAISVAQTHVPSATSPLITVDGIDYTAVFQSFSVPPAGVITAPVQYGDGGGGNLNGCVPFAPGSLVGKIVLVDRGTCFFSTKILNIGDAGGEAGIIGLVATGDPFNGACGDCPPFPTIPGYMISQVDSNAIKAQIGNPGIGTIDPDNELPLVGSMVSSSSRGPQHDAPTLIKPEIGAPGASVSAVVGTGTGTSSFGGTSGASPMVAGSAALLLQAEPALIPAEVKARLMNTGETAIYTDPTVADPQLAPITRIGGGEVRVDRAFMSPAAAWDDDLLLGGLSFGFVDVEKETVNLHKTVRVRNYSEETRRYSVIPTFRFADDEMNGAVSVHVPRQVTVRGGSDATFPVKLTIKGQLLRDNYMSSGPMGANPVGLDINEYDGYLVLDDGEAPIHLPWHVLPRKAADVVGRSVLTFEGGVDEVDLTNTGVGTAQNDAYALLAVSPNQPEGGRGEQAPTPDLRAVGINTFPVPAFFCSGSESFIWAFAVNTWERQEHLNPVHHNVILDTDQDGSADYVVFNADLGGPDSLSDGRQVAWVQNLGTGSLSAFFFAEHSMNTGNTVLYICGEQIGMNAADLLTTTVDMTVVAQDWYFGGPGDAIEGLTVTPLGEQYVGSTDDIAGKSEGSMTVTDYGPFPGNSPELGVMLLTNGDRGGGFRGGATQATETLFFTASPPPLKTEEPKL